MKTIHFLCLAMLFSFTANSQITKGNFMVGGSGSFTNTNTKLETTNGQIKSSGNTIILNPNIGYFIKDKFAIGSGFGVEFNSNDGSNKNYKYNVGPFVKYYYLKTDKMINIFSEIGFHYVVNKSESFSDTYGTSFRIKSGVVLFFNSSVAVEASINYVAEKLDNSDNNINTTTQSVKNDYFIVGIGFQIHLEK